MKRNISMFPTLTDELFNKIEFSYSFCASYQNDEHKKSNITIEKTDFGYQFIDTTYGKWAHEDFDTDIKINLSILHPKLLFGQNGIAPSGSTIGIALMWTSQESSQRGIVKLSSFTNTEALVSINEHWVIPKSTLRKKIDVSLVLFIKTVQSISKNEHFLAHSPGTLIGSIPVGNFIFEDSGSIFPIVEVEEPTKPLWWVECNWDNCYEDYFDLDSFAIYLNRSHKFYSNIDISKGINESILYREIVCNGVVILIQNIIIEGELDDILSKNFNDLQDGTIAKIVHHFVKTFNLKTASIEELSESIRNSFDNMLKGEK